MQIQAPDRHPPVHLVDQGWRGRDGTIIEATAQFGTPHYLYSEPIAQSRYRDLLSYLPNGAELAYSAKANPNPAILLTFSRLGSSIEISSEGELDATSIAKIDMSRILFTGPGKSEAELKRAAAAQLRAIVVESHTEFSRLQKIARETKRSIAVALRINSSQAISSGRIRMMGPTQFGMSVEEAITLAGHALADQYLRLTGLHAFAATGILEPQQIVTNTAVILETFSDVITRSKSKIELVDVGGGFGIPLYGTDLVADWSTLRPALEEVTAAFLQKHPSVRSIVFESGRWLIGPAGVFITRVVDVKAVGDRRFVMTDGGSNVFHQESNKVGARISALRVIGAELGAPQAPATICGPLCTPTDRLAAGVVIGPVRPGNLICFYNAGAYGLTHSPGLFLSHGFPSESLWTGKSLRLIRKRTTARDFLTGTEPEVAQPQGRSLE